MKEFIEKWKPHDLWATLKVTLVTIVFGGCVGVLADLIKEDKPLWAGKFAPWVSFVLIVAAVIYFGFHLYLISQQPLPKDEHSKQKWNRFLREFPFIALATVIFGVGVGLLGDSMKGEIVLPWLQPSWYGSTPIVLFFTVLVGFCLLAWAQKQLPVHSVSKPNDPEPHKVLILPLSVPSPGFTIETDEAGNKFLLIAANHRIPITSCIVTDEEALRVKEMDRNNSLRWNWTQILTSIRPHLGTLKQIHLITSIPTARNKEASSEFVDIFQEFVHCYDDKIEVLKTDGIDFEDFGAVYWNADRCINDAKRARYREQDIIIDVTGGTKVTSIASSVVTLHNDIKFQYSSNGGNPQEYEAIYVSRSALG